jgi:hypothetical protein
MKKLLVTAFSAGALAVMSAAFPVTASAATTETPIVQVCAATSIAEVDQILNQLADSNLIRSLDGIVGIDVPEDAKSIEIDDSVQLSDIRKKLNCTTSTEPSASETPDPSDDNVPPFANCAVVRRLGVDPVSSSNPRFQKSLDLDGDGIGCETNGDDDRVKHRPKGAPETGEGPANDQPVWLLGGFGLIAAAGFAGRKVLSGQA